MVYNKYSTAAIQNIMAILNEAAIHRCDIVASMNIIIGVLVEHIDTDEKLRAFLVNLTEEMNKRLLSIIPPLTEVVQ